VLEDVFGVDKIPPPKDMTGLEKMRREELEVRVLNRGFRED
jgi:hypothetical protein